MSDLTALHITDMAKAANGLVLARASLGVTSFGMLEGRGTLITDDAEIPLEPGIMRWA